MFNLSSVDCSINFLCERWFSKMVLGKTNCLTIISAKRSGVFAFLLDQSTPKLLYLDRAAGVQRTCEAAGLPWSDWVPPTQVGCDCVVMCTCTSHLWPGLKQQNNKNYSQLWGVLASALKWLQLFLLKNNVNNSWPRCMIRICCLTCLDFCDWFNIKLQLTAFYEGVMQRQDYFQLNCTQSNVHSP